MPEQSRPNLAFALLRGQWPLHVERNFLSVTRPW